MNSIEELINPDLSEEEKRYHALKSKFDHPPVDIGYVYAFDIKGSDLIKIGRTKDPERRLTQLNTGLPVAGSFLWKVKVNHHVALERECHILAGVPVRGEWFKILPHELGMMHVFLEDNKYSPVVNIYDIHSHLGISQEAFRRWMTSNHLMHDFNGEWCLSKKLHDERFATLDEDIYATEKGIDWLIKKYITDASKLKSVINN